MMRLRLLVTFLGICAATAAHAGSEGFFADAAALLLGTRLPEVKMTSDGAARFTRRYDGDGRLSELTYRDDTLKPALVEKLEISRSPAEVWVRTVLRGGALVSRSSERYAPTGELASSETLWSSSGRGPELDRRSVATYSSAEIELAEYQRAAGEWTLVSRSILPATHAETPVGDPAPDTKGTEKYLACLDASQKITDAGACRKFLEGLPLAPQQLSGLGAAALENLSCVDGDQLFQPNGFSIDLKSCSAPAARESLKQLTSGVVTDQLSCLNRINPVLARKLAGTLAALRPQLKCAGTRERVPSEELCGKSEPKLDECKKKQDAFRSKVDAFYEANKPNDLYLSMADPMGHEVPGSSVIVGAPASSTSTNGKQSVPDPQLAATIFHEALHSCGHHHHGANDPNAGPLHDATPPDFGDAVYGCESLCGPSPLTITAEGCVACATAEGNKPGAARLASCAKFPKADLVRKMDGALILNGKLTRCENAERDKKADACAALATFPEFKSLCGDQAPSEPACLSQLRKLAARQILGVVKSPGGKAVFAFTIGGRAQSHPYEVTDKGIDIPGKDNETSKDGFYAQKVAALLVDGFCEDVRALNADFTVSGKQLAKLNADYGGGAFPDAPPSAHLRPRTSGQKDYGAPYPPTEMTLSAGEQSKFGLKPDSAIGVKVCKSWFERRDQGFHP